MDEDGIREVLKTERMGHEMPGMHGVYGRVSPAMRADSHSRASHAGMLPLGESGFTDPSPRRRDQRERCSRARFAHVFGTEAP